jgi:hypothetical protein
LVETCEQLGLPDAKEYAEELKRAKKKKEVQQAVCAFILNFATTVKPLAFVRKTTNNLFYLN